MWTITSGFPALAAHVLVARDIDCHATRRELEANWDAIRRIPDDMLVVTLAMICPFEPVEKQALLEAPTQAERGAALLVLLQMGAVAPDEPAGHSVS